MGGLWHSEKRARFALLGAGLPLPLLPLLLPMLVAIGAKGTPGIQAVRPVSAGNGNNMDHQLKPTASVGGRGGRGGDHPRRMLSTDQLDEESGRGGVPITTRFVFADDFNWLDGVLSSSPRPPLLTATAAAPAAIAAPAASVRGSDLQRQQSDPLKQLDLQRQSDPLTRRSDPLRQQRGMQTVSSVCSPGDDFSLTSTVHAEAGGCYSVGANDTNAYLTADLDRIVLPASISGSSSTGETFAWVAGKVLGFSGGSLDVDPECVSDEPWTVNSHPTDAGSWSCLVGGTLVAFSQESFGIECGCSSSSDNSSDTAAAVGAGSTPSPASTNTSTPATSPSPVGGLSCDAVSIAVTSPQLDAFEGCYTDNTADNTGGGVNGTINIHYGQTSGELGGGGVNAVFAASIDERGHDVRWIVGAHANLSTDSGIVPTCISDDNATSVHPADSTWLCDLAGTGAFVPVNETHFQVGCGCNSTSSSSSSTNSEETTPSPGGDSRNVNPSTPPTEGPAGSRGSAAVAPTPSPSPNGQSAAAVESGANGGSRSCAAASGAFSAFGVTALGVVVGLVRLFGGE